jgi:hypothetical protein
MKSKKGHYFFQAQAGGFCNNRKVRVSRFSPKWEYKVGSLAKHFLNANSTKYIQFLDKWIPVEFTLDCPPALLL